MTPRTLRLAHRGDWRVAPENSLQALQAGARLAGCDGVEFDVRLSRDGQPVILHDETLERVVGVAARAGQLSADELGRLGVPRLTEVLASLPRSAVLNVDVKEDIGPTGVEILAAGRGAGLANALVSSFEPAILRRIGGLAPAWALWLNAKDPSAETIGRASDLGCRGISVEWHALDRGAIDRAAKARLQVAAWTVTRRSTYRRLASLGLWAIIAEGSALEA